jgi:hypothetical protein
MTPTPLSNKILDFQMWSSRAGEVDSRRELPESREERLEISSFQEVAGFGNFRLD